MRHYLKILILLSFVTVFSIVVKGQVQEVIASSGGFDVKASGSLSWTVGEGITETYSNSDNILTQGFQQPGITITEIEKARGLEFGILAFPNPTFDKITLKINSEKQENLSYEIFDLNGKLLGNGILIGSENEISFKNYKPSTYLIKILQKSNSVQTFKIILK